MCSELCYLLLPATRPAIYLYLIADDAFFLQSGPANVLTISKKKVKNIGIFLKDEDEEDEEEPERPVEETKPEMFGRGKRSAVIENKLRVSLLVG